MRSSLLVAFIIGSWVLGVGCSSRQENEDAGTAGFEDASGVDLPAKADAGKEADSLPGPLASSTLARETAVLSQTEKADLATSLSAFAFDLWQELRRDPAATDNFVFSPTSISLALGMAYAGAKSDTASQMKTAMHITSSDEAALRSLNWLDQQLGSRAADALASSSRSGSTAPDPSNYRLHVVNACWGDRSMPFEQPYLDTLATNFGSGVHLADFRTQPETERIAINDWVAQETLDRIKDLIPPGAISAATRAVLINAIHLKLPWYNPFQQADTRPGTFTKDDGTAVSASFMYKKTQLDYAEDDTAQVVSLWLAGGAVELIAFLPATTLAQFEDALSPTRMQNLVASMKSQEVVLKLPKFSFTTAAVNLRPALATLGMGDAFTPNADFTGITQEKPLFITDILHKAMVGVNEQGVEAAAATAVMLAGGIPPEPKKVTFDVPFFFGIYDRPTATWLFLGHVTDPSL